MRELSLEKIRKRRRHFVQDLKTASVWAFQIFVVCLFAFVLVWYFGQRISTVGDSMTVSYTHLTLPTKRIV